MAEDGWGGPPRPTPPPRRAALVRSAGRRAPGRRVADGWVGIVALSGCAGLVAGSLQPWATYHAGVVGSGVSYSVTGIHDGRGVLTLVIGAVIAAVYLVAHHREPRRLPWGVYLGLAIAAGVELVAVITVFGDVSTISGYTQAVSLGTVAAAPGAGCSSHSSRR
ncbi:MAG TPA: hypothetical protein VG184_05015 [Acidimicrobiales bacterium]|nr:hypothetical protein [Acidimicrobiales bacterium]